MMQSMRDDVLGTFRAFLFDMDGTLLSSRTAIERVWNAWSARWDLDPKEVSSFLHGRRATDALDHFLPNLSLEERANEVEWVESREFDDTDGVIEIPGAAAFLSSLPPDRWAIVTSAARRLAVRRLEAAGLPQPTTLLAAEDVAKGKPDPSGYIRAADILGTESRDCLIFEDAPAGIKAAIASGGTVIQVGNDPDVRALPIADSIHSYAELEFQPTPHTEASFIVKRNNLLQ